MNYYNRIHELVLIETYKNQGLSEDQINEFLGSLMKGIGSGLKAGVSAGVDTFKKDRAAKKAKDDGNKLAIAARTQREQMRKDPKSVDPKKFRETQLSAAQASLERRKAFAERRGLSTKKMNDLSKEKKLSGDRFVQSWRVANRNPGGPRTYTGMSVASSTDHGDIAKLIRESFQLNEKKLCARGKSAAKSKFDVYPSAYANMYASAVCSGKVKPGGKKK
jgi:hypothetical protein